jgi:hypothetical protein
MGQIIHDCKTTRDCPLAGEIEASSKREGLAGRLCELASGEATIKGVVHVFLIVNRTPALINPMPVMFSMALQVRIDAECEERERLRAAEGSWLRRAWRWIKGLGIGD